MVDFSSQGTEYLTLAAIVSYKTLSPDDFRLLKFCILALFPLLCS